MRRVLILLALSGCGLERHTRRETLEVDGQSRSYLVHAPAGREGRLPLVLVFHGGFGTADGAERASGFSELSDREGFIVVYPQGLHRHWHHGQCGHDEPNDLRFVGALLDRLARDLPVDPDRIYIVGASNGAGFCHLAATRFSDRIAAFAAVIGGMTEINARDFTPSDPVSALIMNGTEDPIIPDDGRAVAHWVNHNGCRRDPVIEEMPDGDPGDGTRVRVRTYREGRDGTEVVLYSIEGGGHTWPGGSQYLAPFLIGRVCRDFDATETIWKFLASHPKNDR